ncbi:hypothetical protein GCM10023168_30830 [Fodinibacter luteus]|uniref:Uncharacterized protein n=1 Tax=Fodinibacter luteus TaxID=552064 RepID=A0ABP8KME1_9MICO
MAKPEPKSKPEPDEPKDDPTVEPEEPTAPSEDDPTAQPEGYMGGV